MGNSLINDIKAPELSQTGYGAGIKNVFEQIDANFKILGNQDFVKGDQGWSIGHNEVHITYSNDNRTYFTKEGIDVLNVIIKEITDQQYVYDADDDEHQNIETVKAWLDTIDALKSVNNISLIDSIVPSDLFNEIYVYDPINPSNQYTIGATNDYVFKDRRFVIEMDNYDEIYSSLYDCSCMVHLQAYEKVDPDTGVKTPTKKFVVIQNAPTLYFDTDLQAFCWRIGGQNTGLIAQGPKGDPGQNATFYIVELGDAISDAPSTAERKMVTRYMDSNGGWAELGPEHPAPADFADAKCIAFEPTEINDDETPTSYFGKIVKGDDGSFSVSCTNENRIQTNLNLNWLAATFASIRTNKALKGLFIPIVPPRPGSSYNKAPVHAIWHASARGSESIFSELHMSPMLMYAGIDGAANKLEEIEIGVRDGSRLSVYDDYIYTDQNNPVPLVFDYDSVIFAGHHNHANGVRIGIGTNNIFNDSVGSNSLVRFSANSMVYMPGTSYLEVGKINTDHIVARNQDIDISCRNLNIFGKNAGSDSAVSIAGTLTVTRDTSLGTTTINGAATINGIATVTDSLKVGNTATATVNGVPNVYLGCPIGTVVMWAGSMETDEANIPDGWLLCDGSRIYVDPSNCNPIWLRSLITPDTSSAIKELIETLFPDPIRIGGKDFTKDEYDKLLPLLQVIRGKWGFGNEGSGAFSIDYWKLPDLRQKFPLGAAAGSLKNGWDSSDPSKQILADTTLGAQGGDPEVKLNEQTMPKHKHKMLFSNTNSDGPWVGGVRAGSDSSGDRAWRTSYNNGSETDTETVTGGDKAHSNMPPYLAINFIIKYK